MSNSHTCMHIKKLQMCVMYVGKDLIKVIGLVWVWVGGCVSVKVCMCVPKYFVI